VCFLTSHWGVRKHNQQQQTTSPIRIRVVSEFPGAPDRKGMERFYKLILGLNAITSKALVEKGRTSVDMLTNNASYTLPVGFLASITTACDTLEQTNEEVLFFGGKVNHQAKRIAQVVLKDLIRELGGYIQAQSGGNEAKILSAGFNVRSKGQPVDKLGPIGNLRPRLTDYSGDVPLCWNKLEHATNYQIFMNPVGPEEENSWELVAFTSKITHTVKGLTSGKFCWFRVQAIGRKGLLSPMSQAIKALAA